MRVLRTAATLLALGILAGAGRTQDAGGGGLEVKAKSKTAVPAPSVAETYRETADRILEASRTRSLVHERLRHLCDVIGPRLTGSAGHVAAAKWCVETMKADGLDDPREELVMAPVWVRGDESARMIAPRELPLHMLGLGNSVGTPAGGVTAEVVVVGDLRELKDIGDRAKGKIVLFNFPMPKYDPEKGTGYGATVTYRVIGPSRAAAAGAVAVLVRSVTATSLQTPHTGMLSYAEDLPKVPAAAVSIEDAELIARLTASGERVRVHLEMAAQLLPDAPSPNVVAELKGREKPGEIIVIGGHLDSWDVGQGAHDDGGGAMMAWEAVRLLKALDLRPRRTIRVVLFTNEENGLRGGQGYADMHVDEMANHVAALESDSGSFRPLGFTTPKAEDEQGARTRACLEDIVALLESAGADDLSDGGGGADIGRMAPHGVLQLGLRVDMSTYFDIHHTHADTFDKVNREDLEKGAGVMAVLVYVLAEMEQRVDRVTD